MKTNEIFYKNELEGVDEAEWPAKIDGSALDFIVLNCTYRPPASHPGKPGPCVYRGNFGEAAGGYYVEGLKRLAGPRSDLNNTIGYYKPEKLGRLVYKLNEFGVDLQKGGVRDINRAVESLVEKFAASSIKDGIASLPIRDVRAESATDLILPLLSDPSFTKYFELLMEQVEEVGPKEGMVSVLDRPQMVTPLWRHQKDALHNWQVKGSRGYVDMATATGKTVLGIAAIALKTGQLCPMDQEIFGEKSEPRSSGPVLVVVDNRMLIEQWRREFDKHLDIPLERTSPDNGVIGLGWGKIEFRTARELHAKGPLGFYDLVILDEAHRYKAGSGKGWRWIFNKLAINSNAMLAMSGSVSAGWAGDDAAKTALEAQLDKCMEFTLAEAREAGVVADFNWEVHYAAAEDNQKLESLKTETEKLRKVYNTDSHRFDLTDLKQVPDDVPKEFATLKKLRAFGQSTKGREACDSSKDLKEVVTAALARRTYRWNLTPTAETIADLVDRHAPDKKCVVLVQGYAQAKEIGELLKDRHGDEVVLVPESSPEDQDNKRREFNNMDRGIIIGPRNLLGVGVDMPDAEVAINLAGGGGVNVSLLQHIGRVLRNPSGDKDARFYHVLTVPLHPDALLIGEDGRRLLRRAIELRAFGYGIKELPGFSVESKEVSEMVHKLEAAGLEADGLNRDIEDVAKELMGNYIQAIDDANTAEFREELIELLNRIRIGEEKESVLVNTWRLKTLRQHTETRKKRRIVGILTSITRTIKSMIGRT